MPELPEVEAAMDTLRQRAQGRTIARVELLHPSLQRRVQPAQLRALIGARVARAERRGKHQLLHLDDGRIIHVHFRLNGDWEHGKPGEELPRFARAVIDFDDDTRLILVDSRALGTLDVHPANAELDLGLGPDAADATWTAEHLRTALATKRGPIKPALLDQRLVAGLGNIYAAESLWRAKISPFMRADALSDAQVRSLREAIAAVILRATGSRYTDADTVDLDVYDREGLPCRRCRSPIERVVQAGRSTFFCPHCQPHGGVATKSVTTTEKGGANKRAAKKSAAKKTTSKKRAAKQSARKKVATKKRVARKAAAKTGSSKRRPARRQ